MSTPATVAIFGFPADKKANQCKVFHSKKSHGSTLCQSLVSTAYHCGMPFVTMPFVMSAEYRYFRITAGEQRALEWDPTQTVRSWRLCTHSVLVLPASRWLAGFFDLYQI